jgi:glucose uptake protein GlcU
MSSAGLFLVFTLGAIVAIASGLAQRSMPIVALGVILLTIGAVLAYRDQTRLPRRGGR